MKVLVAGATGVIGRSVVAQLRARKHTVVAASRGAGGKGEPGLTYAVVDVLDREAVRATVAKVRPDAVVSELTNLPKRLNPRRLAEAYAANNRVRLEGTLNLLAAAQEVGVRRFVAQSVAFWYAPTPGGVKTEQDPLWRDAPEPLGEAVRTVERMEASVLEAASTRPALLRYGTFYGPGTWFAADGIFAELTRRRQYPLVAGGRGITSFVHIEDAAAATVAAVEGAQTGLFNITDDAPAPAKEWVPVYARAIRAPPPRRVPLFLARFVVGRALAEWTAKSRGASNSHAKTALGWTPRHASWREGFGSALA